MAACFCLFPREEEEFFLLFLGAGGVKSENLYEFCDDKFAVKGRKGGEGEEGRGERKGGRGGEVEEGEVRSGCKKERFVVKLIYSHVDRPPCLLLSATWHLVWLILPPAVMLTWHQPWLLLRVSTCQQPWSRESVTKKYFF